MIAALLLAWPAVQEPTPAQVRELESIAADLADGLFARRPWLAPERAWPKEVTPALGRYGARHVAWWVYLVGDLQRRSRRLDFEPFFERDAIAAMIEAEAILAASRTPERWDASRYVERVERTLFAARHAPPGTPEAQARAVARVLAELPDYWSDARSSLVAPLPARSSLAIGELQSLERSLREDAAADGEDDRRRLDEAVRATAGFRAWLEASPASPAGGATTVGARHWEQLVQAASGLEESLAEIKKRLLRELLALERTTMTSTASPVEVAPDEPGDDGLARARAAMDEIAARLLDDGSDDEGSPIATARVVLDRLPARERAAMLLPDPDGGFALRIDPRGRYGRSEVGRICLAIRHGFPGEAALVERARNAGRAAPMYLWSRSTFEGWGLYVLDWATRPERGEWKSVERDQLERVGAELRKLEVARLLAALEIHAEGLSLAEEAEVFRRRSGRDLEQAVREVRTAQSDPLLGIGYLGYLGLRTLEDELVTRGASLDSFVTPILSHPHLRPADLNRKLRSRASH